jgi:hypothetical protein
VERLTSRTILSSWGRSARLRLSRRRAAWPHPRSRALPPEASSGSSVVREWPARQPMPAGGRQQAERGRPAPALARRLDVYRGEFGSVAVLLRCTGSCAAGCGDLVDGSNPIGRAADFGRARGGAHSTVTRAADDATSAIIPRPLLAALAGCGEPDRRPQEASGIPRCADSSGPMDALDATDG